MPLFNFPKPPYEANALAGANFPQNSHCTHLRPPSSVKTLSSGQSPLFMTFRNSCLFCLFSTSTLSCSIRACSFFSAAIFSCSILSFSLRSSSAFLSFSAFILACFLRSSSALQASSACILSNSR